jgi:hypothetical protein
VYHQYDQPDADPGYDAGRKFESAHLDLPDSLRRQYKPKDYRCISLARQKEPDSSSPDRRAVSRKEDKREPMTSTNV